ncbi:MAG TPA: heavy metal translocating P-type ATPase metal-binding domain-containing protein, partial [Candidatus Xenobia bacterium]
MNTCRHCSQPSVDEFCCPACRVVYETICGAGLQAYYRRREVVPSTPSAVATSTAWMNRAEAAEPFLAHLANGDLQATFLIDGLHCAACCWLVEKAVGQMCREARVNYSTSRLTATWSPQQIGMGDIMARVASVGYRATPATEDAAMPADRVWMLRLAVAGFSAGNVMLLAAALYCGAFSGMEAGWVLFFHWVSLVLCLPVVGFAAVPFWQGACAAIRHRVVTMDLPIAVGLATTFSYSVWATLAGQPKVYFDTVAMFVFVLLIGRTLERSSQRRVASTVERLLASGARTARRIDGVEIDVRDLLPGDVVEVRTGDKMPVDGVVLAGRAWVDEAMLTGESTPVEKSADVAVTAATLCVDGTLQVRATRTGSETTLAQMARLVAAAQERRAPIQRVADRAAAVFIGVVLGLSVVTLWLWHAQGWGQAMMVAVSVLIVTCPCALGLATPLAVATASGRAAAAGILLRGGDVLEALQSATCVVLDKTGTVTEGVLEIRRVEAKDRTAALRVAAALERHATHPVARAFLNVDAEVATDVHTLPGLGVEGRVHGRAALLGSPTLLRERGIGVPPAATGETEVWLAVEGQVVAMFALADRVRTE